MPSNIKRMNFSLIDKDNGVMDTIYIEGKTNVSFDGVHRYYIRSELTDFQLINEGVKKYVRHRKNLHLPTIEQFYLTETTYGSSFLINLRECFLVVDDKRYNLKSKDMVVICDLLFNFFKDEF